MEPSEPIYIIYKLSMEKLKTTTLMDLSTPLEAKKPISTEVNRKKVAM